MLFLVFFTRTKNSNKTPASCMSFIHTFTTEEDRFLKVVALKYCLMHDTASSKTQTNKSKGKGRLWVSVLTFLAAPRLGKGRREDPHLRQHH